MAGITTLLIIIILFFLLQLMPGSPFNNERLTEEQQAVLYTKYGLDKPLPLQIAIYVKNMVTGDFGVSYNIQQNYPVASLLATKFPTTIRLGLQAFVVGILLGLILGIISALHHNGPLDTGTTIFSMLGSSVPSHVLALGLVYFLAYKCDWFPLTYSSEHPLLSSVLPTMALAIGPMAMTARYTRNEMIEVMDSEYITLAETKGVHRFRVVVVHGLKNALIPLITFWGMTVADMIAGSIVVEQVFNIPGLGRILLTSISRRDYPVVEGIILLIAVVVLLVNFLVDILYRKVDPRLEDKE